MAFGAECPGDQAVVGSRVDIQPRQLFAICTGKIAADAGVTGSLFFYEAGIAGNGDAADAFLVRRALQGDAQLFRGKVRCCCHCADFRALVGAARIMDVHDAVAPVVCSALGWQLHSGLVVTDEGIVGVRVFDKAELNVTVAVIADFEAVVREAVFAFGVIEGKDAALVCIGCKSRQLDVAEVQVVVIVGGFGFQPAALFRGIDEVACKCLVAGSDGGCAVVCRCGRLLTIVIGIAARTLAVVVVA